MIGFDFFKWVSVTTVQGEMPRGLVHVVWLHLEGGLFSELTLLDDDAFDKIEDSTLGVKIPCPDANK
jgi:hypothetical protein